MGFKNKIEGLTSQLEHDFYMKLVTLNKDNIFSIDVIKVRQLSNAYLKMQMELKQLIDNIENRNFLSVESIVLVLEELKHMLDDDLHKLINK